MRLRHVKGAKDLIASHKDLIIDNIDNKIIDIQVD